MNIPKTIFCDIDGTLVLHQPLTETSKPTHTPIVLQDTIKKLTDWNYKGYYVVLTTGRRESQREETVKQLNKVGIFYDQLIMGLPRGTRIVINDQKPDGTITAEAYSLERDKGIGELDI